MERTLSVDPDPVLSIELPVGGRSCLAVMDVEVCSDGKLLSLDGLTRQVTAWSEDGVPIWQTTIGGPPGLRPSRLFWVLAGRDIVFLPDPLHSRVEILNLATGRIAAPIILDGGEGLAGQWDVDGQGVLYQSVAVDAMLGPTGVSDLANTFRIRGFANGRFRTLIELPPRRRNGSTRRVVILRTPRAWTVQRDGTLVLADGERLVISHYSPAGAESHAPLGPQSSVRIPPEGQAVIRGLWLRACKDMFAEALAASGPGQGLTLPDEMLRVNEVYPEFVAIKVDDLNRLWLRLPASVEELTSLPDYLTALALTKGSCRWRVIDESLGPIATVVVPLSFEPTRIRHGHVYGHRLLAEGRHCIQVFRLRESGPEHFANHPT